MFQHSAISAIPVDLPTPRPRTSVLQGLARLEQAIPLPRTLQEYLTWALLMGLVAGLAALQVNITVRVSKARLELARLDQKYNQIQRENAQLLWQISQYTTLERVAKEAEGMGFRPTLTREYVRPTAVGSVPPRRQVPTQTRPETPRMELPAEPMAPQTAPFFDMSGRPARAWSAAQIAAWKVRLQPILQHSQTVWNTWTQGLTQQIREKIP